MTEVNNTIALGTFVAGVIIIAIGILLINFGKKAPEKSKKSVAQSIVGWALVVLTIIGLTTGLILWINADGGITGTWIFAIISPLFIIAGMIICLSIGIASLIDGYRKDKNGNRDTSRIVQGWFLLILVVLLLTAIITTLAVLFNNYSMSRGDEPVRMM